MFLNCDVIVWNGNVVVMLFFEVQRFHRMNDITGAFSPLTDLLQPCEKVQGEIRPEKDRPRDEECYAWNSRRFSRLVSH